MGMPGSDAENGLGTVSVFTLSGLKRPEPAWGKMPGEQKKRLDLRGFAAYTNLTGEVAEWSKALPC